MPRRLAALAALVLTVLLWGGCGGSSSPSAQEGTATTTPAGAPGSVSVAAGSAVPLGLAPAQLEARLGAPATPLRPRPNGFSCMLYRMQEKPPFVKLQYCFRHGRLKYLSTYAVGAG